MTLREYGRAARAPRYSILVVAPLFAIYEASSVVLGGQAAAVRNGADVLLRTLFGALGGPRGLALFTVLLAGLGLVLVLRDLARHPGRLSGGVFALMLGESLAWAFVLGAVTATITAFVLDPLAVQAGGALQSFPVAQRLVLSAGAGLYEELVFRVLLVSGLVALGGAFGWRRRAALAFGVVGSAVIFAAFHHVGPYGDPFALGTFTFRMVAGLLLSGLYVARGFGIAAWSHALYDVLVSVA